MAAETRTTISFLPPEILSDIFILHRDLHRNSEWNNHNQPDLALPSIRVSHVSKIWRDTALFTPWLWTTLASLPVRSESFYKMMINRSRESFLHVYIQLDNTEQDECSAYMLLECVALQTHRLATLYIRANWTFISKNAHKIHGLSAPHLTRLFITNTRPVANMLEVHGRQRMNRIFTLGARKLLHFESVKIGPHFQPPLGSLTSLNLMLHAPVSYTALYDTLGEAAPVLVRLSLALSFIDVSSSEPISMPALLSIDIKARMAGIFIALGMIRAPSLHILALCLRQHMLSSQHLALPIYSSTVDRYPKLHTLSLAGTLGDGILAPFPTITELSIYDETSLSSPTILRDTFDPQQRGFSMIVPELKRIVAPPRLMEALKDFCAARALLGFSTLTIDAKEAHVP